MTITISDIPNAVADYLNTQVTSTVSTVTPDVSSSLQPGEDGTFSVTVVNASAPTGVRLTDVKHHLTIPPTTPIGNTFRAKFHVPATPPARATTNPNDPVLAVGIQVAEMFLFPLDPVLEIGDTDTVSGLEIHALSVGDFEITCHIHGDMLVEDLIPNGENNRTARRTVTIS